MNLSSENNLPTFHPNAPVVIRAKVTTGAFSQNVSKSFSELKLLIGNFSLFNMQQPTEKPLKRTIVIGEIDKFCRNSSCFELHNSVDIAM